MGQSRKEKDLHVHARPGQRVVVHTPLVDQGVGIEISKERPAAFKVRARATAIIMGSAQYVHGLLSGEHADDEIFISRRDTRLLLLLKTYRDPPAGLTSTDVLRIIKESGRSVFTQLIPGDSASVETHINKFIWYLKQINERTSAKKLR